MNYQDKARLEQLREELATVDPAYLQNVENVVANLPKAQPDSAKQRLLKHYADREPTAFYQLDAFTHCEEDSVFHPDEEGDTIFGGETQELMTGAYALRVLVTEGTTRREAVRLLRKVLSHVEQGFGELAGEPPLTWHSLPDFDPRSSRNSSSYDTYDEDLPF